MITFCDGSLPSVLKALECLESPFREVKKHIKEPWYMKFNNSAIYQGMKTNDAYQSKMTEMFWNICMHSFDEFYKHKIDLLPVKSLT